MVNIYAPNAEKERNIFFKAVQKLISQQKSSNEHCIIGGDFNYTPDPNLDRDNRDKHDNLRQDKSSNGFRHLCQTLNLTDIWRLFNPAKVHYTCQAKSRIDYFLVNDNILHMSLNTSILNGPVKSDHMLISLNLKTSNHKRGPGYWKLNCSYLEEEQYRKGIKQVINNIKQEKFESRQLQWEMCKIKIKEFSSTYGRERQQNKNSEIKQLELELKQLESMIEHSTDANLVIRRDEINRKIEKYYLETVKAAQIRSRIKWVEEGEKGTKFFLGLEKKNQENNVITCLNIQDKIISSPTEILKEEVKFYSELYTSSNVTSKEINDYLSSIVFENKLSEKESILCEGLLSLKECTEAVINMKMNKSPGCDGLPPEFYKTFWSDIANFVVDSLNEAFTKGELSATQKRAIMSLLFKKGDRQLLQNWRPISLLNTDYKIGAFALAARLHTVLAKLVNSDQTGYVKNRYIGCNIRLIEDIIDYININNKDGIVLFCDFEKAFDTVEIDFLLKVLDNFNFGPQFIRWIKTFYTNASSCIKNNNWISTPFSVQRGIRQGCPISALLFILVTEVMATKIRSDKTIKGITLPSDTNNETKISMLADDTTIFVKDNLSAIKALKVIEEFGIVAGPKLNKSKTIGMQLGRLRNTTTNIGDIKWTSDHVKALGVYFGHDIKSRIKLNWEDKIKNVERCLQMWTKRNLSLVGRILIVKTFGISKLTYLASSVACSDEVVKKVHSLTYNFIWKGKRDHVKRDTIMAKKEDGGLNMTNFRLQEKALKAMMLKRILEPGNERWKILPQYYLNKFGPDYLILRIHSYKHNTLADFSVPKFYKDMIAAWHDCRYDVSDMPPGNVKEIRQQIMWENTHVKYKGKTLYFNDWIEKGIIYVNQVYNNNGIFKEKDLLETLQGQPNAIMEIFMLKNAIPPDWKVALQAEKCTLNISRKLHLTILVNNKTRLDLVNVKNSKIIYNVLVQKKKKPPSTKILWQNWFQEKNIIWTNVYVEKLQLVKEPRLEAFNFKVINNILATPQKLFKWRIIDSDVCHLCFTRGDLEHMMINCNYFADYYSKIKAILRQLQFSNVVTSRND